MICVGEIRDEETAEIALRAAQTGHLVLATIHCDSNATALIRLLDLGVSPMLMSSGLEPAGLAAADAQALQRVQEAGPTQPGHGPGIPPKGHRHEEHLRGRGRARRCGGTGYYGRTAICDLLVITEELRREIAHDEGISGKLRSDGEKKGRSNMRSEAIARVIAAAAFDAYALLLTRTQCPWPTHARCRCGQCRKPLRPAANRAVPAGCLPG